MKTILLQELLREDGITFPESGGAEKSIKCFAPGHDDDTPSMSVNVAKGVYNCHGCEASGNAYTYLTEIRGWSKQAAMERLKEAGMSPEGMDVARQQHRERKAEAKGEPKPCREPWDQVRGHDCVAEYEYVSEGGELVYLVRRYEKRTSDGVKKILLPFTPNPQGGWWCCAPMHDGLPAAAKIKQYPLFRLPQILPIIRYARNNPQAKKHQIWIVEGEKCANAVARCQMPGDHPPPPVTSLYGGSKHPLNRHDLSPLYGHAVLILADADRNGRSFAKKVGRHLKENNTECRYVMPPGNSGDDVADAIKQGNGWSGITDWIQTVGGVLTHSDVFPPTVDHDTPPLHDTPYFRVLGMGEQQNVLAQSKVTNQLLSLHGPSLSREGTLVFLAPLKYWRGLAGGGDVSPKQRMGWADAIIRAAEAKGVISVHSKQMWRRGAIKMSDGNIAYNVGDGVLVEGESGHLTEKTDLATDETSKDIFLPGPTIELVDDPRGKQYGQALFRSLMQYRWERREHGLAFCGWIVASLVGGALPFRCNLWLTAPATTGKTWLFERVLGNVFGDLAHNFANPTEAGIAGMTSDEALPCLLDEFEPEKDKAERNAAILSLVRIATSGSGGRVRGTAAGGVTITRPRFSLLCASIDKPNLTEALETRFFSIRLSRRPVANWPSVRDAIVAATNPERMPALRTAIIRRTIKIVERARVIEDQLLLAGADTRSAQQRAALSAGVEMLSGVDDGSLRIGPREVSDVDVYGPMSAIFSALIRRSNGQDVTVAEALQWGYFTVLEDDLYDEAPRFTKEVQRSETQRGLINLCLRYGIKMPSENRLWIAPGWPRLAELLERTVYANLNLDEYVRRLPGATLPVTKSDQRQRMKVGGLSRAVVEIPRETLVELGFFN